MPKGKTKAPKVATPARTKPVEPELVDLTKEEGKHLRTPHKGFEQHVDALLGAYQKFEALLQIPGFTPAAVRASLARAAKLQKHESAMAKQLEVISESRRLATSTAWGDLLNVYDRAKSAARTNKEVERAIADFVEFMKTGPRKKSEPKAP